MIRFSDRGQAMAPDSIPLPASAFDPQTGTSVYWLAMPPSS